jgi:release factor glutamine methyltransferase
MCLHDARRRSRCGSPISAPERAFCCVGSDLSPGAIAVARTNAARLGLAARAGFIVGDFGAAIAGGFDLLISNPPYIEHDAIAGLQREVREHDPHLALDGGPDGLACYRAIAHDAIRLLAPDGALIVELGQGQREAVTAIMTGQGLRVCDPARNDLAGIPRALTVRPPS